MYFRICKKNVNIRVKQKENQAIKYFEISHACRMFKFNKCLYLSVINIIYMHARTHAHIIDKEINRKKEHKVYQFMQKSVT